MTRNALLELFPVGDPLGRRILSDPISAITGGIGLIGNLAGGLIGSSAASSAAATQQQAAQQAGQQVTQAAQSVNPGILSAGNAAGQGATAAAGTAASNAAETARNAGLQVGEFANNANNLLEPWQQAGAQASGTLAQGLQAGGQFNKAPTLQDLQIDPGYAFRLQQGEQTLNRSAAARGGAISGSALKDLTNYSQGAASQEYQNAFNRFEASTQNRVGNLMGVSNAGQNAAGNMGQNLIGAAKYGGDTGIQASEFGGNLQNQAADFSGQMNYNAEGQTAQNTMGAAGAAANYLTQGANAQAQGQIQSANAWGGALNGASNAVGAAGQMYQGNQQRAALMNLLQNPAAAPGFATATKPFNAWTNFDPSGAPIPNGLPH